MNDLALDPKQEEQVEFCQPPLLPCLVCIHGLCPEFFFLCSTTSLETEIQLLPILALHALSAPFSLLSPFLPQASSTALLDFILRHCRSEGKGQFIYYIHVATHATIHV